MSIQNIGQDFHKEFAAKVRLVAEDADRFRVLTPFQFDDGDHLVIVLKKEGSRWILSDEAHTYMHLTYDISEKDLLSGTREKIIKNALSSFQVVDRNGELVLGVPDEHYGDALYSFVQALLKISDVSFLNRERVRSTFMEDFRGLLEESAPKERIAFDWLDPKNDPEGIYTVDCRINSMAKPLFVQGISSNTKARDATIVLHHFKQSGLQFNSLAIYEDKESISRIVSSRVNDVCDEQFPNFLENQDEIKNYVGRFIAD